jgi:hypothetical protein
MESTSDNPGDWLADPQGWGNPQDEVHTSQEATEVIVKANAVTTGKSQFT